MLLYHIFIPLKNYELELQLKESFLVVTQCMHCGTITEFEFDSYSPDKYAHTLVYATKVPTCFINSQLVDTWRTLGAP